MKRFAFTFTLFLIFSSVIFISCPAYGLFQLQFDGKSVDERSSHLTKISPPVSEDSKSQTKEWGETYSFLVFTDTHFGSKREELNETLFFTWLEKWFQTYSEGESKDFTKLPRFAINLGDTADTGKKEQFQDYLIFENKIKAIAGTYLYDETSETVDSERGFKVYSILGNHDLYNYGAKYFEELIFPYTSSYFFQFDATEERTGFSFYFLDSANGTMGANQIEDLKKKLDSDDRPKIIFTHYPIYAGGSDMFMIIQDSMERNLLLTYFAKGNVKQVYEGHAHRRYGFDLKTFREDVIGSLRYTTNTKKQCAIVTVNEATKAIHTEIIEYENH